MDFVELEAIEGLCWSWNSWPVTKSNLIIPLSIIQTPLMKFNELPILSYDPLSCRNCGSILNPYARVDYPSRIWVCPFCYNKNSFPRSYAEIGENNIPAELFPTYSTVEYILGHHGTVNNTLVHNWETSNSTSNTNGLGLGSLSKSNSSLSKSFSSCSLSSLDQRGGGGGRGMGMGVGPVFVFVVDGCSSEEEIQALKNELLLIVAQLPENAMVGLVVFDSMVRVYDLGLVSIYGWLFFMESGIFRLARSLNIWESILQSNNLEKHNWYKSMVLFYQFPNVSSILQRLSKISVIHHHSYPVTGLPGVQVLQYK